MNRSHQLEIYPHLYSELKKISVDVGSENHTFSPKAEPAPTLVTNNNLQSADGLFCDPRLDDQELLQLLLVLWNHLPPSSCLLDEPVGPL